LVEGLFVIADLLLILACFLVAHRIVVGSFSPLIESLLIIQATLVGTYVVFRQSGTYRSARGRAFTSEIARLFLAWMVVILWIGLFAFLTKTGEIVSRRWFGASMLSAFLALTALRFVVRHILMQLRERGLNWRSVLIVGTGPLALQTIASLDENNWTGMKVVGIVAKDESESNEKVAGYDVVATCSNVHTYIEAQREKRNPVDQIWIALPLKHETAIGQIVDNLKDSSTNVCIIPDLLGSQLMNGAFDQVGGIPLISLTNVRITSVGEAVKRLFDVAAATIGVIVLSPLYLIIAVLIKLESRGAVFFKQKRYGLDGRVFLVWKFRSMTTTEDGDKVTQAVAGDARITRVGRYLRRTSLDEIPQLFNVIGGTMSLVGPRPHAVVHNEEYRRKITGYMMRHKIKPGITGWAQVNGWRGETDTLEKMEKRVEYDLEYMKNWSPWFDIKILALTVVRGFVNKNAY